MSDMITSVEVVEEIRPAGLSADLLDDQLTGKLVDRARSRGLQLTGEGGLLQQLIKRVLESALEGEITDHLGYEKHRPGRRGKRGLSQRRTVQDRADRGRSGRDRGAPRPRGQLRAADRQEAAASAERGGRNGAVAG